MNALGGERSIAPPSCSNGRTRGFRGRFAIPPKRLQREVVRLNSKKPADAGTSNRLLKHASTAQRRGFFASTKRRLLQPSWLVPSPVSLGDAALRVLDQIGEAQP
jgi:hypothetical protein